DAGAAGCPIYDPNGAAVTMIGVQRLAGGGDPDLCRTINATRSNDTEGSKAGDGTPGDAVDSTLMTMILLDDQLIRAIEIPDQGQTRAIGGDNQVRLRRGRPAQREHWRLVVDELFDGLAIG